MFSLEEEDSTQVFCAPRQVGGLGCTDNGVICQTLAGRMFHFAEDWHANHTFPGWAEMLGIWRFVLVLAGIE